MAEFREPGMAPFRAQWSLSPLRAVTTRVPLQVVTNLFGKEAIAAVEWCRIISKAELNQADNPEAFWSEVAVQFSRLCEIALICSKIPKNGVTERRLTVCARSHSEVIDVPSERVT